MILITSVILLFLKQILSLTLYTHEHDEEDILTKEADEKFLSLTRKLDFVIENSSKQLKEKAIAAVAESCKVCTSC